MRWLKVKALLEMLGSNGLGMKRCTMGSLPQGTLPLFPKIGQYDLTIELTQVSDFFISLFNFLVIACCNKAITLQQSLRRLFILFIVSN